MIPVYIIRGLKKRRQIEQPLTKTSNEVVENREVTGLSLERNVKNSVYCEERGNGENGNVQPVEVVETVTPSEWRQGLLVFQRP